MYKQYVVRADRFIHKVRRNDFQCVRDNCTLTRIFSFYYTYKLYHRERKREKEGGEGGSAHRTFSFQSRSTEEYTGHRKIQRAGIRKGTAAPSKGEIFRFANARTRGISAEPLFRERNDDKSPISRFTLWTSLTVVLERLLFRPSLSLLSLSKFPLYISTDPLWRARAAAFIILLKKKVK